jgi:hypothetical protein
MYEPIFEPPGMTSPFCDSSQERKERLDRVRRNSYRNNTLVAEHIPCNKNKTVVVVPELPWKSENSLIEEIRLLRKEINELKERCKQP